MDVAGRFDYVIVGAGSAGCVLAARLTEDPSVRVLLLESGPRNDSLMVNMPAGSFKLMGAPRTDWLYEVEPDGTRAGRRMMWSAGRMLGGSSAMNGMVASIIPDRIAPAIRPNTSTVFFIFVSTRKGSVLVARIAGGGRTRRHPFG